MEITILGHGGAINLGLPYNAFMIDRNILCEMPPDIMRSLREQRFFGDEIETIFISHFHGDHIFGVPFFLLNTFIIGDRLLRFVGPKSLRDRVFDLTTTAFGSSTPCLEWLERNGQFIEIEHGSVFELSPTVIVSFFELNHSDETYGFEVRQKKKTPFVYIADTLWCDSIADVLKKKPNHVLLDMNGEPDDPVKVHLSEDDLIEKAFPITGQETIYYGTHMKADKLSKLDQLIYAQPGQIIEVNESQ